MIVIPDRLALRRSRPDDLDLLDAIDRDDSTGGVGPGPGGTVEERMARRWTNRASDQFVFFRLPDLDPIGSLTLYDTDARNGATWLTVRSAPAHRHDGLALLGVGVGLTVTFRETALRRVYAQVTDLTLPTFRSVLDDGTAEVAVTFPDALAHPDGTTSSLHWLVVERPRWEATWARLLVPHLQERSEGDLVAAATTSTGRTAPCP